MKQKLQKTGFHRKQEDRGHPHNNETKRGMEKEETLTNPTAQIFNILTLIFKNQSNAFHPKGRTNDTIPEQFRFLVATENPEIDQKHLGTTNLVSPNKSLPTEINGSIR